MDTPRSSEQRPASAALGAPPPPSSRSPSAPPLPLVRKSMPPPPPLRSASVAPASRRPPRPPPRVLRPPSTDVEARRCAERRGRPRLRTPRRSVECEGMGAGVVSPRPSATRVLATSGAPRSSRRRSTTPWRRRLRLCAPTCPLSRFRQRGPPGHPGAAAPSRRARGADADAGIGRSQRRSASARGNLVGRRRRRNLAACRRCPARHALRFGHRPDPSVAPAGGCGVPAAPPAAPTFAGGPAPILRKPVLTPAAAARAISGRGGRVRAGRSNGVVEQSPSIQIAPAAYAPRAPSAPELPVVVGNFCRVPSSRTRRIG